MNIRAVVHGDMAYTTSTFITPAAFGAERLNNTNVLRRVDGKWKVIHHHPDKAPALGAALERMAQEG